MVTVLHNASAILTLIDNLTLFGSGGREMSYDFIEFFALAVELAYRELLVLDLIEDLTLHRKK